MVLREGHMNEQDVRSIIRAKGLCGRIIGDHICILEIDHNDGTHEVSWTVTGRTISMRGRNSGIEPVVLVVFDVYDASRTRLFTTDNETHARWLAGVLTRLES